MAKKSKGGEIELLYTKPKETKKIKANTKKKPNRKTIKKMPQKDRIDLNNEIIIGLTPKKNIPKKQNKKTNNAKDKPKKNNKKVKQVKNKTYNNPKKEKKRPTIKTKLIKWISLFLLLLIALLLFLLSSVFNIKKIVIIDNSKISKEEIINLSGLTTNDNIFKMTNRIIKTRIKENAYIENVKIKRKLDCTIEIIVKERQATYMLPYEGYYVYINNQGYILEISDIKPNIPSIIGYKTSMNTAKAGDRLALEDLQKLNTVIKIMEVSKSNYIDTVITSIDIANKDEYILDLESEGKKVYFGDNTNVNEKILWILKLLEEEKGKEGDMLIQNVHKAYFREKV